MAKKSVQPKSDAKGMTKGFKSADATILLNPRVTEKSAKASGNSVYVFDVALSATKSEIAKAFAAVYKHVPVKVRTVTIARRSVSRRTAKGTQVGFAKKARKAYIALAKGTSIEII